MHCSNTPNNYSAMASPTTQHSKLGWARKCSTPGIILLNYPIVTTQCRPLDFTCHPASEIHIFDLPIANVPASKIPIPCHHNDSRLQAPVACNFQCYNHVTKAALSQTHKARNPLTLVQSVFPDSSPVQSHPIQSRPIQSNPIQSSPI